MSAIQAWDPANGCYVDLKVDADGSLRVSGSITGTMAIASVARTAALTSDSGPGEVEAGATEISFANTGDTDAAVAGGTLPSGCAVTFDAPKGDTLGAVDYDATGTTLLISTVK